LARESLGLPPRGSSGQRRAAPGNARTKVAARHSSRRAPMAGSVRRAAANRLIAGARALRMMTPGQHVPTSLAVTSRTNRNPVTNRNSSKRMMQSLLMVLVLGAVMLALTVDLAVLLGWLRRWPR